MHISQACVACCLHVLILKAGHGLKYGANEERTVQIMNTRTLYGYWKL